MLIIRDMPVLFYVSTSSRTHIFIVVIRTNAFHFQIGCLWNILSQQNISHFNNMKSWGFFLFEDGLLRKMKAFNNLCFKREQFLLTFILLIFY